MSYIDDLEKTIENANIEINDLLEENKEMKEILSLLKKHIKINEISDKVFVIHFVNNAILNFEEETELSKELKKIKEWYKNGN